MGQGESTCAAPPRCQPCAPPRGWPPRGRCPHVGLHSLPGGVRLVTWTTRTRLMVWRSLPAGGVRLVTCATRTRLMGWRSLPAGGVRLVTCATRTRLMGWHSFPGGVRLVTWTTRTRLMGCTHSRGVSDWLHGPPELDFGLALTPRGCQIRYILAVIINCCPRPYDLLARSHSRGVSD
jgi:hypothetical protein